MDASSGSGLSADEWIDILKWLCGGIAFLLWGYLNRMGGRIDKMEDKHVKLDKRVTRVESHLDLPPMESD